MAVDVNTTFEEALAELENIVKQLEGGKIPLEQAVQVYQRGMELKQFCNQKLASAKLLIDELVIDNGKITGVTPFNAETVE